MIPPVAQRLTLQTAVAEAARLALEGSALAQRDLVRVQALHADLEASALDVPDVDRVDPLAPADEGAARHPSPPPAEPPAEAPPEEGAPASDAAPHLDLLA